MVPKIRINRRKYTFPSRGCRELTKGHKASGLQVSRVIFAWHKKERRRFPSASAAVLGLWFGFAVDDFDRRSRDGLDPGREERRSCPLM